MTPTTDAGWEAARAYLIQLQADCSDPSRMRRPDDDPTDIPTVREHLRKVYDSSNPQGGDEGFEQMLKEYREQLTASRARCPSPYENPDWYSLVIEMFDALSRSATEMNLKIAHPPLLGTLPTGRVNGVAIALEDSATRIILIEQGLFGFANLMCKAVASALPFEGLVDGQLKFSVDPADIRKKLDEDDTPIERFFDALCSYVLLGEPHRARPYAPPPYVDRVSSTLRESMELFILGHELGHVALGHLDGKRVLHAVSPKSDAQTVQTNWEQEFSADLIGLMLMLRTMIRDNGMDVALSYWGAHLFFGCIDIVERTVSLLATGEASSWRGVSHPPTTDRQKMLQLGLTRFVDSKEATDGAIRLAGQVDEILAVYWERCVGPLRAMHAKGLRPTAEWMAHTDTAAA